MLRHIASEETGSTIASYEPTDIQPNALDVRLDKVYMLAGDFHLDNDTKKHRSLIPLSPNSEKYFELTPGYYQIVMQSTIKLAPDEAGHIISRSTLIRNGVFIISGLYDSGYEGIMAAGLYVTTGRFIVKQGTRIGQFLLYKADAVNQYNGDYGIKTNVDNNLYGVVYKNASNL